LGLAREITEGARCFETFDLLTQDAEYWVGNSSVTVKRFDTNAWAFLMSVHVASRSGMNAAWILLADSIAGSFIMLAPAGLLP
jgi:uncharacterized protein